MTAALIHSGVAAVAADEPHGPAVVEAERTVTYGELDAAANAVAHDLVAAGTRVGDRVVVALPKGADAVIAILGVLKAGAGYVPIDPAGPDNRLTRILTSCRPRAVLTDGEGRERYNRLADPDTPPVTMLIGDSAGRPTDRPVDAAVEPDDLAYILFTSGSTGMPKGVPISHASVTTYVDWARHHFRVQPHDRLSGHSPLHFDLSVYDMFGALRSGASLHPVAPELNLLPRRLADFIRERQLTQWFSVPSILTYLTAHDAVADADFPALERLHWCGEVFPTAALRTWMERLPHVSFTNLYGPTEATIASSWYHVTGPPDDGDDVPIGTPCPGEELEVLDADLRPVTDGGVGDLWIGGVGLSPGYWEDPVKTAAAFRGVPRQDGTSRRMYATGDLARRDSDGLFHFVGRADTQIKTRGYRIELGEIENAVHTLDAVEHSVVVAIDTDGFEAKVICCAYVSRNGPLAPADLRRALAGELPSYMLPRRWMPLDEMPRNANGKLDRRHVKELFEGGSHG